MTMRVVLALLTTFVALAACAHPTVQSSDPLPPTAPVRIGAINLIPEVARWDTATRSSTRLDRAAALRKSVLEKWFVPYGTFFRVPSDSALARYIDWLTPRLPQMYRSTQTTLRELQPSADRVARVFPSLGADKRLAFVAPSLGNTNGTVRMLEGKPMLIVGVDVQTILPDSDVYVRAALEHELVHVAHAAVNPAVYGLVDRSLAGVPAPLYVSLFSEGLATWGSARADGTLAPAHYYMSASLPNESPATCERLAPRLRQALESTDQKVYADWFFLTGKDPEIPRRYAYVLGQRVVRHMARRYSPEQMLRLDLSTILSGVRAALGDARGLCAG